MKQAIFWANLFALILASSPAAAYNCSGGRYSLTVNTEPPNSRVRIMNIRPKYRDGICLKAGWYDIKVTHPDYHENKQWIEVNRNTSIDVVLTGYSPGAYTCPRGKYSLTVNAEPSDSRVRIMNIRPKYRDGICLKSGWYDIKVTHPDYPGNRLGVVVNRDTSIEIALMPERIVLNGENAPMQKRIVSNEKNAATVTGKDHSRKTHCPVDSRLPNHVTITKPKNGDKVGGSVTVKGTFTRKDRSRVWVLLHPKVGFLGQWWPQNKTTIHPDGTWEALAYVGGRQDVGMEFEIAVAAFGVEENRWIEEYHKKAAKDGSSRPIDFPKTTSNICIATVRKTSH